MNKRILFLLLVALLGIYQFWTEREIYHQPGILVAVEPKQSPLPEESLPVKFKDVIIKKLADYNIRARVLSTRRYWMGPTSDLFPYDVAVGWKEMSDTSVLEKLNISQANRFYFYQWHESASLDADLLSKNSANMHLIAATPYIEKKIKYLRKGNLIHLTGQLVAVNFKDGSEIKSSLSRDDTGSGACELMLVNAIEVQD